MEAIIFSTHMILAIVTLFVIYVAYSTTCREKSRLFYFMCLGNIFLQCLGMLLCLIGFPQPFILLAFLLPFVGWWLVSALFPEYLIA